jgi:hypothetical protein
MATPPRATPEPATPPRGVRAFLRHKSLHEQLGEAGGHSLPL